MLSKLKISSIKELLYYINDLELKYRDVLNVNNSDMTFGVELEFVGLKLNDIARLNISRAFSVPLEFHESKHMENENNSYFFSREHTNVIGGCEIESNIMRDNKMAWNDLKSICNDLVRYKASAKECSTHMHFGAHVLGNNYDNWLTLIKIWAIYERIIYNFYYGEDNLPRKCISFYAKSINKEELNCIDSIYKDKDFIKNLKCALYFLDSIEGYRGKYLGLCIHGVFDDPNKLKEYNTIEVRVPNGTLNEAIIQNNINFFAKLLNSIINNKIDVSYINDRFRNRELISDIGLFNNFKYDDALELADMIFDNELDRYYFLKQLYKLYNLDEKNLNREMSKVLKLTRL